MMSHSPETSAHCHKEEARWSQPQNKQAVAEQLRLLTAKLIQSEFVGQEENLSYDIATEAA